MVSFAFSGPEWVLEDHASVFDGPVGDFWSSRFLQYGKHNNGPCAISHSPRFSVWRLLKAMSRLHGVEFVTLSHFAPARFLCRDRGEFYCALSEMWQGHGKIRMFGEGHGFLQEPDVEVPSFRLARQAEGQTKAPCIILFPKPISKRSVLVGHMIQLFRNVSTMIFGSIPISFNFVLVVPRFVAGYFRKNSWWTLPICHLSVAAFFPPY